MKYLLNVLLAVIIPYVLGAQNAYIMPKPDNCVNRQDNTQGFSPFAMNSLHFSGLNKITLYKIEKQISFSQFTFRTVPNTSAPGTSLNVTIYIYNESGKLLNTVLGQPAKPISERTETIWEIALKNSVNLNAASYYFGFKFDIFKTANPTSPDNLNLLSYGCQNPFNDYPERYQPTQIFLNGDPTKIIPPNDLPFKDVIYMGGAGEAPFTSFHYYDATVFVLK